MPCARKAKDRRTTINVVSHNDTMCKLDIVSLESATLRLLLFYGVLKHTQFGCNILSKASFHFISVHRCIFHIPSGKQLKVE